MKAAKTFLFAVAIAYGLITTSAQAVYFSPQGLAPGTPYQLIFVTSGTISATSNNIATYNSFVQAQAAMNPALPAGATWSAVVSTASVNAVTNAPAAAVPLYWTDGYQDSENDSSATATFEFANNQLYLPPGLFGLTEIMVRYDQFGNFWGRPPGETAQEATDVPPTSPPNSAANYGTPDPGDFIFTGSFDNGKASSFPAGSSSVTDLTYGDPGYQSWDLNANTSLASATQSLHILALSNVLFAPVPEPGTLSLATMGCLLLAGLGLFRRRAGFHRDR